MRSCPKYCRDEVEQPANDCEITAKMSKHQIILSGIHIDDCANRSLAEISTFVIIIQGHTMSHRSLVILACIGERVGIIKDVPANGLQ